LSQHPERASRPCSGPMPVSQVALQARVCQPGRHDVSSNFTLNFVQISPALCRYCGGAHLLEPRSSCCQLFVDICGPAWHTSGVSVPPPARRLCIPSACAGGNPGPRWQPGNCALAIRDAVMVHWLWHIEMIRKPLIMLEPGVGNLVMQRNLQPVLAFLDLHTLHQNCIGPAQVHLIVN
jgi:hypothetical protein